ncbi:hypothetical protein [Paraglaciecola chathamensis]|jgi:hypothetical protein|uniref:Uncharacterized protein n=1 Tax=Paraglaciecola chathamensis TaxID=368405 RepID=A0A8H9IH48_9ALTE|nr:hypothetical protein [Paraglaciecola oceanifecundans]AEE25245.1 hypothetical protein Glaag_4322 [Glaciecola sp. 4H-3-7+YE-5]GGZ77549.1 hypothetical protein GCM10011274_39540 [Paraglaciecola oceanifecundans]|tara:strand:+ start:66656 stop:66910 length:255 start_codon:yes stop_codon:yes gene_type:complete
MLEAMHYLTCLSYRPSQNLMLCLDQFGNKIVLAKEGEPAFAEWGAYNYIQQDKTELTTPLNIAWEIAELPLSYKGELTVGQSSY